MKYWSILIGALLLSVTATVSADVSSGVIERASLGTTTADTIARDYANERQNGRVGPKLGLALSGGGTRAALFAHGVLHGLREAGVLDHVDVISSVSGGGYAAFWYYARRLEAERNGWDYRQAFADCVTLGWAKPAPGADPELQAAMKKAYENGPPCENSAQYKVDDPYRWQAHLARWPDVFQTKPTAVDISKQSRPTGAILSGLGGAISRIASPKKTGEIPLRYQKGIERIWGLEPVKRSLTGPANYEADKNYRWQYTNATASWPLGHAFFGVDEEKLGWRSLRAFLDKHPEAPNWILNGRIQNKSDVPHPEYLFEIGAYGHGSEKTGFRATSFQYDDLGTAVRISGAFLDSQGMEPSVLRTLANGPGKLLFNKEIRWGLKVSDACEKNEGSCEIADPHVSDGGGEDNLGLYTLIRRGVPDIIVVDASYDVEGNMEDLCRVKSGLEKEGFKISFPALADLDVVCDPKKMKAYNTAEWLNKVVEGRVTWPADPVTGHSRMPPTRLWYVKLAWDQQSVRDAYNEMQCSDSTLGHDVPCGLLVFYGNNTKVVTEDGYMRFPVLRTVDVALNSSPTLLWAYRDLGKDVVRALRYTGTQLENTDVNVCQQSAYERRIGKRPKDIPAYKYQPVCHATAPLHGTSVDISLTP